MIKKSCQRCNQVHSYYENKNKKKHRIRKKTHPKQINSAIASHKFRMGFKLFFSFLFHAFTHSFVVSFFLYWFVLHLPFITYMSCSAMFKPSSVLFAVFLFNYFVFWLCRTSCVLVSVCFFFWGLADRIICCSNSQNDIV